MDRGKDACLPYEMWTKAEVTLLGLRDLCDKLLFSLTVYLPMFTHDPGNIDLGVMNNIWQVGRFENIDSMISEDRADSWR